MISNKFRFHGHGSLRFLFKNGNQLRSKYFGLKFIKNPRRSRARLAVIVSKKIYKSAVRRNRIRRRVYEIVRLNFDFSQNIDLAITIFSPDVLSATPAELEDELQKLLKEVK